MKNSLIFQPELLANLTVKELVDLKERIVVVENVGMEIDKGTMSDILLKIGKLDKLITSINRSTRILYLMIKNKEDSDEFVKQINLQIVEGYVLFAYKYGK